MTKRRINKNMASIAYRDHRDAQKALNRKVAMGEIEDTIDEISMIQATSTGLSLALAITPEHPYWEHGPIHIFQGDITDLPIKFDAIVNAARPSLLGGGGVDGAIHKAGGHAIVNEIHDLIDSGEIETPFRSGEAVITNAGRMRTDYVIHVVGPVYDNRDDSEQLVRKQTDLYNSYLAAIELAENWNLKRIAFPLISSGSYSWPLDDAANLAVRAVLDSETMISVTFVARTNETLMAIEDAVTQVLQF
jgi:O-acetyl-ADP-ribose deacetylase (regulator of RNase III)